MSSKLTKFFDRISDHTTDWLGSTASLMMHTTFFIGIFALKQFGVAVEEILLILTTLVSLEAIYLAIFIQRSVNKQSVRLDTAIKEIIHNVSENLEEPLDEVVGEIRKTVLETHRTLIKTIAVESDQVVKELSEKVESETDDLESSLKTV